MSSSEYRPPGRPAPTANGLEHEDPLARDPGDEPGLALGSLRQPRVAAPAELEPHAPHDPAMTRAPTEPMPPELLAIAVARAVGTDPPPLRQRLPAPAASTMVVVPIAPPASATSAARAASTPPDAPRMPRASTPSPVAASTEPPTARMVAFGNTTILLVPAGDRIALVVPGVLRLTATRAEALALAEVLRAVAQP
ncbi:MAG: hypothetical protein IPL61_28115 [Myxococcales bacterium]|nr:hypothetical protein [Myxococcales bacterium]